MACKSSSCQPARQLLKKVDQPGTTQKEMLAIYDNWSEYDKDMKTMAFQDGEIVKQVIIKHFPGNQDIYILDIAAGTGLLAQELKAVGITNVDAVDPSEGMMQIAKAKNLYKRYMNMFFTEHMECIETSMYDAVVVGGSIGESHVEVNTFPEMIRCVKPGGLVVMTIAEGDYNDAECKGKLEPSIERLEREGLWKLVEKTFLPDYCCDCPGYLFVMKITKTV